MVCVRCEGTGVVVKPRSQVDVTCPSCGGIGNVPDWPVSASEAGHDLGNRIAQALFAAQPFTFSLMIFEGGRAYLYRLDNAPHATKPLLTIIPRG